jgi:hypothetical protein
MHLPGTISKQFLRVFWDGIRAPMRQHYFDGILAVVGIIWVALRARQINEIAWDEIAQTIAPLLWIACVFFCCHIVIAARATAPQTQGWAAWAELISLTGILLCVPIWLIAITYPGLSPNAPRHLDKLERKKIIAALSPYKGQLYALDWTRENPEVQHFAEDFDRVLHDSGWQKVSYGPLWAPIGFASSFRFPNQFRVQWYISDRAPKNPVYSVIRSTLHECCGITADGVRWPDPQNRMDTDIIYFYIGPRYMK